MAVRASSQVVKRKSGKPPGMAALRKQIREQDSLIARLEALAESQNETLERQAAMLQQMEARASYMPRQYRDGISWWPELRTHRPPKNLGGEKDDGASKGGDDI